MPRLRRCALARESTGEAAASAIGFNALKMAAKGARRLCDTELRRVHCNSSALRGTDLACPVLEPGAPDGGRHLACDCLNDNDIASFILRTHWAVTPSRQLLQRPFLEAETTFVRVFTLIHCELEYLFGRGPERRVEVHS